MCYACEIWSHTSCIGMTDQKYKQIQNFGESVDWICKYCRENKYEMRRENQSLKKVIEELNKENESWKKSYQDLEKSFDKIKQELKADILKEVRIEFGNSLQPDRTSSNKDSSQVIQLDNLNIREEITKVLKEQEEKKMRKNNIVLYNISESTKQNAKERDEEDLAKTKELISQGIKVEGCRIEKMIRLGRTTEGVRSRPILVKMEEQGDKWNVLKNAKNLKNAE